MDRLSISCINGRDNLPHDRLQLAQGIRDRPRIRHADVRPHISIRGSDARRVLESAADELQAGGKIITAAVEEGNESCRREMRHMADDRGTAVVLCEIERRKSGTREPQNIHQTFLDLLRDGRVVDDDVRLMGKEILRRRRNTALFASRHRMSRDIVDIRRQDLMQLPVKFALRTSCIRQDRTALQVRQDPLYHRNNLEDGRAEVHNVRIPDNRRQIRPCIVHRTAVHRRTHGLL